MDVRPIEMLHVINKSAEVSRIQSNDQHRYINMQQYMAEEAKIQLEHRMAEVNYPEQAYADNNISEDDQNKSQYQPNRNRNEDKEGNDKEKEDVIRPSGSVIDIMI
ncbi:hypothetical protein [Mahella australiensis]|uniref:Uncharacterized protein n=1 Tax=Mahella australiensis (strain DSM 15567 / CIP 107919 / 50-1 BON) TaxID=697281 RepID=F4A1W7_MAHA5|nr:hypothetical protein [Mahella australiensis]AEE96083.1 hypothetical protein Mahau_0885 [Mahella australiensis 50-1 BON]